MPRMPFPRRRLEMHSPITATIAAIFLLPAQIAGAAESQIKPVTKCLPTGHRDPIAATPVARLRPPADSTRCTASGTSILGPDCH